MQTDPNWAVPYRTEPCRTVPYHAVEKRHLRPHLSEDHGSGRHGPRSQHREVWAVAWYEPPWSSGPLLWGSLSQSGVQQFSVFTRFLWSVHITNGTASPPSLQALAAPPSAYSCWFHSSAMPAQKLRIMCTQMQLLITRRYLGKNHSDSYFWHITSSTNWDLVEIYAVT